MIAGTNAPECLVRSGSRSGTNLQMREASCQVLGELGRQGWWAPPELRDFVAYFVS